ncbi:MAG: MBL fold metallo-hydrolase [Betaproteobacteria bacterium]|nr:MBL fold metallo-hydrolase [Betaproteobacteria bacterium]
MLPVTAYQQNCSLVVCDKTQRAALVDLGGDVDRLLAAVAESGATLEKILVTHGHIDHCGGAAEIALRTGVPIEGASITGRLWPYGDDIRFVPGHGPMSTFGDERRDNPYVGDEALGAPAGR